MHGEKLTCRLLSLFDLKNVLEATKIDHWQNCLCEAFGEVFSVYCESATGQAEQVEKREGKGAFFLQTQCFQVDAKGKFW